MARAPTGSRAIEIAIAALHQLGLGICAVIAAREGRQSGQRPIGAYFEHGATDATGCGFSSLAKGSLEKHNGIMATNVLTPSPPEPLDLAGGLSQRFLRSFRAQVEDWYDVCRRLSLWEERRLVDEPTPEDFREHARILEELERTGRWVALVTQNSDFPDRATAELVAMTLKDLTDRRALWHGTMTPEQREKVLGSIFHES